MSEDFYTTSRSQITLTVADQSDRNDPQRIETQYLVGGRDAIEIDVSPDLEFRPIGILGVEHIIFVAVVGDTQCIQVGFGRGNGGHKAQLLPSDLNVCGLIDKQPSIVSAQPCRRFTCSSSVPVELGPGLRSADKFQPIAIQIDGDRRGSAQVHIGDELEQTVGWDLQVRSEVGEGDIAFG